MTSVLLMLLLSVSRAPPATPVPSCPASCVVCSEDAVICRRLAHIIDAPNTTQALLLTEGSISVVQPASLSDLNNVQFIGLSHNRISALGKEPFRDLPFLHTLLLDHNLLTNQALQGGALTNLTQLEVLALGSNLISIIQADWLKGTKTLRRLKLEGNLLTSLDSGSFPLNDLRGLESLDLSDNLIDHLDRNSFSGLVGLRTLDLSRNRLRSAPVEAFSYLTWLTNLNLDLNSWNCTCQLLELAALLSNFMQHPDKILYNGRRMVCVSADNPVVTTVLELSEANCVPSNQNITVQVETRGSVTPRLYARDLAITAVICFIGGVGLTLLVVLVYHHVSHRKKLKENKRQKEEEERSIPSINNHVNRLDGNEKKREAFLKTSSSQTFDKRSMMLDTRLENHRGQFRSSPDEDGSLFTCPDCSGKGQRGMGPNPIRWNNRINWEMEAEEERGKRRTRIMAEEERRKAGTQQGILGRDKLLSLGNSNFSSCPRRETFIERPEILPAYKTGRDMDSYRTDVEANSSGCETLQCETCHRTYRPPEQTTRPGRIHANMRDSALFDSFPLQHRLIDKSRSVDRNQFDMMKSTELRRESRNVTFDLERLSTRDQQNMSGEDKREEKVRTTRDKEKGRKRHKDKIQSSRLLKVKLNLSPLRKSKVHPRRKNEQGHMDKGSSKKSKDKRQDGKEREDKEGKPGSGKKTKGSSEKMKKSTKKTSSSKEEVEIKEDRGEGKGKTTFEQKKTKNEQGAQENAAAAQDENTYPANSHSGDTTRTADQSASAVAIGQGQNMQGGSIQYQGAGLVLGSAQLSSPFSISAAERNRTTNPSLQGSAGSQMTGSSLSLQGGNILLNSMAPGSSALFPNGPANSIAPSIGISGPNLNPSGAPDNFGRQTGLTLMPPMTSLLATTFHANHLQASAVQTTPLHASHAGGPTLNSAANTAINPVPIQSLFQNQLPPDSSPLLARLKYDPGQGTGLQTGEGLYQQPLESQAPQTMESHPVQVPAPPSAEAVSGVTSQALGSMTTVENLSNNNSQMGGGSVLSVSGGSVVLNEGPAVGVSGDSMQGPNVPGMSTQSGSSTGGVAVAAAAAALLQQEYVSEEGGSSPRRKLRLVLPEKASSRPPTALERKIR